MIGTLFTLFVVPVFYRLISSRSLGEEVPKTSAVDGSATPAPAE